MEKLKHEHLLAMLKAKDESNTRESPLWRDGSPQFMRQAWLHAGLFLSNREAFGDQEAAQYLQDVWRFLLDEWLINAPEGESMEDVAGLFMEMMYAPEKWSPAQDAALQKHSDVGVLVDSFVHLASANVFNAKIFERILELVDYQWDAVYQDFASDYIDQGAAP